MSQIQSLELIDGMLDVVVTHILESTPLEITDISVAEFQDRIANALCGIQSMVKMMQEASKVPEEEVWKEAFTAPDLPYKDYKRSWSDKVV